LIEVKGRLGGSIISERRAGFVIDGGPFVLSRAHDWPWLKELGLQDAIYEVAHLPTGRQLIAFKNGMQALVEALVAQLRTGRIMPHMSVSTFGKVDRQFAVCLENGMVIHAAALIVAAPARYAERMFYTFQPDISQRLLDFYYDHITRVSLGYRKDSIPLPIEPPPDAAFAFGHWTDSEHRVPPGHVLIQVGVRYPLPRTTPQAMIADLQRAMNWPDDPAVARVDYWPESHCLNPHHPGHDEVMEWIDRRLPEGVALIGSDYRGWRVDDRIAQGRNAAQEIAAWLRR
jgi:protoporphyrinogen oxidase